jgi:hypothetical protein
VRNKPKWYALLFAGLVLLVATLVVVHKEPPIIAFSPQSFSFNAQQGETNLLTDTLHISNSGGGTLDWSVSDDAYWLTLSPTSSSLTGEVAESTVSIELHISQMSIGTYTATITIFAPKVSNAPQEVPVTVNITENPRYIYENGAVYVGGDGEPIELINNLNVTNPTFAELIAFVKEDPTDEHYYATDVDVYVGAAEVPYVCSDFAEDVHNNAEAAGIRTAWVSIDFEGDDEGHALNAFETTDRGLVYIDCTGQGLLSLLLSYDVVKTEQGISLVETNPTNWDKVAYVEIGKEYGVIDIAKASSLSYSFYEECEQKWQEYTTLVSDYNDEVTQFNQEVSEYEDASYGIPPPEAPDIGEYGTSLEETRRLYEALAEWETEMEAWKAGREDWETEMEAQWVELTDWRARLEERGDVINQLGEELGDFWFEPLGIVENIYAHW